VLGSVADWEPRAAPSGVAKLASRIQNVLDETRILILGAQILLGFDYRAFFEPRFGELPAWARAARLLALCLLVVALAVVVSPSCFHQLVEGGRDTGRLHRFASRAISVALLPIAVALGLDLGAAAPAVEGLGASAALALGLGVTSVAIALWYALPAATRRDHHQEDAVGETSLETKIQHVLTEARVVLPGAQALLGFQLAVTMMDAFSALPRTAQLLHLAGMALTALTIVLLLAPAAFHRIAERGEETARFHRLASRLVLAALVPLALALGGDLGIVGYRVSGELRPALGLGGAVVVVCLGAWFGAPLAARLLRRGPSRVPARAGA
jgi:uncharacterized protein DUF6328